MSATDTHADETTEPLPGPTRMRPNQIAIVIGVAIAIVVALSGVAATVFWIHTEVLCMASVTACLYLATTS